MQISLHLSLKYFDCNFYLFEVELEHDDDDDDDDDDDWLIVFMAWLTDERLLALFPAGTIVSNPHHCESPTRREQDLSLCRT